MSETLHAIEILRWFWAGVFVLFGLATLWRAPVDASSGAIAIAEPDDEEQAARVQRAWASRRGSEQISPAIRLLPSATAFAAALLSGIGVLSGPIGYGVFMLSVALSVAAAYLQLRNNFPRRVAVLLPRTSGSVVSPVWFVLAAVQGLIALDALRIRDGRAEIGAVFVCVSTLLCAWLAWRVTEMPALLAGEDLAVEQMIDERLRFQRAAMILFYTFAPAFVFLANVHAAAWAILTSLVLAASYGAWYVIRIHRKFDLTRAPA